MVPTQHTTTRGIRVSRGGRLFSLLIAIPGLAACEQRSAEIDIATDSTLFAIVANDLKNDDRFPNLVVDASPLYLDSVGGKASGPATARVDSVIAARRSALKALEIAPAEQPARLLCPRASDAAKCANEKGTAVSLTLAAPWAAGARSISARVHYRGVVGVHGIRTVVRDSVQQASLHFAFLMRKDSGTWTVLDRRA